MRSRFVLLMSLALLVCGGCKPPEVPAPTWLVSESGLGIMDLAPGQGPSPRPGQTCVVYAMGWVEEQGAKGRVFLDTRKRGYPDLFPLGVGRVIKGWDEGLATMKKGGRRLLRVPPTLSYAPGELRGDIPAGATLLFELELLEIR